MIVLVSHFEDCIHFSKTHIAYMDWPVNRQDGSQLSRIQLTKSAPIWKFLSIPSNQPHDLITCGRLQALFSQRCAASLIPVEEDFFRPVDQYQHSIVRNLGS